VDESNAKAAEVVEKVEVREGDEEDERAQ